MPVYLINTKKCVYIIFGTANRRDKNRIFKGKIVKNN